MTTVYSRPGEIPQLDDVYHATFAPLSLITTDGSLLHRMIRGRAGQPHTGKVYLIAALSTYLPMILTAAVAPLPIATQVGSLRLPFLFDWNIAFMFLVSFPVLIVLTVTDQTALDRALRSVQFDGVLVVDPRAAELLSTIWKRRFRAMNYAGYGVGAGVGLILAWFNYLAYTPAGVGYWIASQSRLLISGYVFLGCIFVFYAAIPVYIFRNVTMTLFLRDLVKRSQLHMLPFHPDRCGGMRPVGRLGLRSQYALSVLGLNVVLLVAISFIHLNVPAWLDGLIVAAAVGYALLGPLVFMGPLLPFRGAMLRTKGELMGEVAQRLRVELNRLRKQLPAGEITQHDEELIERLRKIGDVVDQLPVWPFDAGTLKKFLTAYVLPMIGAIGYPAAQLVLSRIFH